MRQLSICCLLMFACLSLALPDFFLVDVNEQVALEDNNNSTAGVHQLDYSHQVSRRTKRSVGFNSRPYVDVYSTEDMAVGGLWDPCTMPPGRPGFCRAAMRMYTYDQQEGICRSFLYGGCEMGANLNKFKTKRACMRTCMSYG